jgi:FtsP/CotA-like multicopper oxidase with cupredoxin domain
MSILYEYMKVPIACAAMLLLMITTNAYAVVDGIPVTSGVPVNLETQDGHISTADGSSVYFWGYALAGGIAQYPGPVLIVNQGDTVVINLTNNLSERVSILFPGQQVITTGGVSGLLTQEAAPSGGTVSYEFIATHPGTYLYHSGTNPELQVEMGLIGAIIVRPTMGDHFAYNDLATMFDREYLFLLSEMDPRIHQVVEFQGVAELANTDYLSDYFPNYWFINGRNAPDTMFESYAGWLPAQPYNCMPMIEAGKKMLMRVVSAGRDMHPFHQHGNHARVIAKDGRLLESATGAGPDLSYEVFTVQAVPGETVDAIFDWTGKDLGWDMYGTGAEYEHTCNGIPVTAPNPASPGYDPVTKEYCPDHGKQFPVILPNELDLTYGGFYSGSPYLGVLGSLPPGEGGLNPYAGFTYMWHSHTEKEMTNYDIFPGGMMTMLIVVPPGTMMMP